MAVHARILKLLKTLFKEMLSPLMFFLQRNKPLHGSCEIWIIYLQTGHEADTALEVNAYLVFKAYLSM